jgi:osmotically-inducible protein OsmY
MSENERKEAEKKPTDDYYAGYYWGNDPYSSAQMPGHKSDEELKNDVLSNLTETDLSQINVSVTNAVAILTGTVKDYEQKRRAGAEAWRTSGIAKVMNNLQVIDPETAGPSSK